MTTTLYRIYGRIDGRDKDGLGPVGPCLLYVGITDHYDRRMAQHAEKRWWDSITKITREEFETRDLAAAAERRAIETERPLYNKALNPSAAETPPAVAIPKARKHPVQDPRLSLAEASAYLGVCTKTLRRYISTGDLPAARIQGSRLIRVRRSDLDAMLQPIPTTKAI